MIQYQERPAKILKRRLSFLRGLTTREKAYTGPFWADLDITQHCNLKCIGCLYHSPHLKDENRFESEVMDMPLETAQSAISQLAEMGAHTIIIQGAGEPLLHPKIVDIIKAVKKAGMFCRLLTNGTMLNKKKAEALIDAGLDSLRLSIWANSPEELNGSDAEADKKTHRRILDGLSCMSSIKKEKASLTPALELYQAINRTNFQSIHALLDLALAHDCSGLSFAQFITRKGQLDAFALSPQEEQQCMENLNRLRPTLNKKGISHNIDALLFRYGKGDKVWEHAACYTPWYRLRILTDGTVKICRGCDRPFGTIQDASLKSIWNGERLRQFRKTVSSRDSFAELAETCDCRTCCFFIENVRVESIFKWIRPFT